VVHGDFHGNGGFVTNGGAVGEPDDDLRTGLRWRREKTGKPLVVLIGADWCGACRVMKNTALPQVAQDAVFQGRRLHRRRTPTRRQDIARQVMQGRLDPATGYVPARRATSWTAAAACWSAEPGERSSKFLRAGVKNSLGKLAGRE
jgi:hypothetical protein